MIYDADLRGYLWRDETGWGKMEVARWLRDLFEAPRQEVEEEEEEPAEHAMP